VDAQIGLATSRWILSLAVFPTSMMMQSERGSTMSLLTTIGILIAVLVGLAAVLATRGRRLGKVDQKQIDAARANSLTTSMEGPGDRFFGEYLPPPDGRPRH
jgi:xanthine/uracil permease